MTESEPDSETNAKPAEPKGPPCNTLWLPGTFVPRCTVDITGKDVDSAMVTGYTEEGRVLVEVNAAGK